MSTYHIDADITRAQTLASSFYTNDKAFTEAREKIFARVWQLVGTPKDSRRVCPVTLLPEFLDEPLLLISRPDGTTCFSNVCTHRGKILVEDACDIDLIKCRYHGRRFSLDGKFLSMPEFETAIDFPTAADNLSVLPVGEWNQFVFASIDPLFPFEELFDFGGLSCGSLVFASERDYPINAHWALYCENYLEGFHIPFVHKSLNEVLDYGAYTTETFRYASLQTGFGADGSAIGRYLFIFPNLMFNFYDWGLSLNIVRPITPEKTVVSFMTFISDEEKFANRAGGDLHRIELEDEQVVESVQKGIRSRFYTRGRYSPTREKGTHHFHRLIAEFMK